MLNTIAVKNAYFTFIEDGKTVEKPATAMGNWEGAYAGEEVTLEIGINAPAWKGVDFEIHYDLPNFNVAAEPRLDEDLAVNYELDSVSAPGIMRIIITDKDLESDEGDTSRRVLTLIFKRTAGDLLEIWLKVTVK